MCGCQQRRVMAHAIAGAVRRGDFDAARAGLRDMGRSVQADLKQLRQHRPVIVPHRVVVPHR